MWQVERKLRLWWDNMCQDCFTTTISSCKKYIKLTYTKDKKEKIIKIEKENGLLSLFYILNNLKLDDNIILEEHELSL